MNPPKIAIVIPCYNEEKVLPISVECISSLLDDLRAKNAVSTDSYVMCVDDGSVDSTWQVITSLHSQNANIKGISLAHNRGHQYALLAGLMTVKDDCDAAISIDADLQDDPSAITEMVSKFVEGNEIVYGVRDKRDSDSWFKRTTARAFYRLQHKMGLETIYDHADYRLMSNRALQILSEYRETNLFLRGIVPQIGLKTAIVKYDRSKRAAGESKYPFKKMLAFSIDGITSFSSRPLRFIFMLGLLLLILDLAMAFYVLLAYFNHTAIPGWTSLMLSVWFLGSVILMSLGIVGEYVGKIFMEVKGRPRFNIREKLL